MRITNKLRLQFRYLGIFGTVGRHKELLTAVNKHYMCRAYVKSDQLNSALQTLARSKAQTVRVEIQGELSEILTSHNQPKKAKVWLIITSKTKDLV